MKTNINVWLADRNAKRLGYRLSRRTQDPNTTRYQLPDKTVRQFQLVNESTNEVVLGVDHDATIDEISRYLFEIHKAKVNE